MIILNKKSQCKQKYTYKLLSLHQSIRSHFFTFILFFLDKILNPMLWSVWNKSWKNATLLIRWWGWVEEKKVANLPHSASSEVYNLWASRLWEFRWSKYSLKFLKFSSCPTVDLKKTQNLVYLKKIVVSREKLSGKEKTLTQIQCKFCGFCMASLQWVSITG